MKLGPGKYLACAFAVAWSSFGHGQLAAQTPPSAGTGQYVQQRWESAQGLPNDSIESVLQTSDGYLWVATERGLSRFDGSHFKSFNRQNAPALTQSYSSALFESRDGTLWIGTALNGLATYKDGAFKAVPLPVTGMQGKITAIREDRLGAIWVGTSHCGLLRLKNGQAERIGEAQGLAKGGIKGLAVDPQGVVWVAPDTGGVASWDGQRFVNRIPASALRGNPAAAIFADGGGTLWIGCGNAVYRFSGDRASLRQVALSHGPVRALYAAPAAGGQTELWVGTESAGLELHRGERTTYFDAEHGFDIDTVQQILVDREGSLWVATDGFGLVQLRPATFRTILDKKAFADYDIRSLAKGSGSTFWIGTGKGLSRYADGQIRPYPLSGEIANRDFRSLLEDREGTLWIGTDGGGVLRVKRGAHRAEALKLPLPSRVVLSLAEDTRHHVWIGTVSGLVEVFGSQTRTYTTADGLPSDVVLALLADRTGRLWAGTPQGLASVDAGTVHPLARSSQTATVTPGGTAGSMAGGTARDTPSETVLTLYEDRQGSIWIGAIDGLYRLTAQGFDHWTTDDGLFSNMVNDIVEGDRGDLWIRSNGEISRIARNALLEAPAEGAQATKYDSEDGILKTVSGGGFPGSVGLPDGTLWFSSHKGLIGVDTRNLATSSLKPPVTLNEFLVDGSPVPLTPEEKLAPSHGNLEFHFAALSFIEHQNLRFRYRLVGFDKQWIDAGDRTTAYYTNIPPGSYRFRVIAANRDGVWNNEGVSLPFTLEAHAYQSVPLILAAIMVSVTGLSYLVLALIRRREEKLVARQHQLEELVLQRTAQLEEEKEQLLEAREDLKNQARRDSMTGLLNRGAILALLEMEVIRSARTGVPLGVAMVDIDHFKSINDTHGHLVGDEVIRQVSARLQHAVRPYDGVARYGGEEFLIILPEFDPQRGRERVERLRRLVADHPVLPDLPDGPLSLHVTCSAGIAVFASDTPCHAETLLASADLALYQAKRAGRNRVVVYRGHDRDQDRVRSPDAGKAGTPSGSPAPQVPVQEE